MLRLCTNYTCLSFCRHLRRKEVLKYHPYHKYSSISIPITSTAMKGFSSQMNTKTFGEVDVISQPVSARREVYEFIIASF